jgi:hypothetical protein
MSNWPLENPPALPIPTIPKAIALKVARTRVQLQKDWEFINLTRMAISATFIFDAQYMRLSVGQR